MKAIGLTNPPQIGSVPDSIQLLDLPKPKPQNSEVVVKIMASTIHVDDISMAQGSALGRFLGPKSISQEQPFVMGSSYSGVVVAIGSEVTNVQIGDDVIGIPQTKGEHGSWADYRCVEATAVMPKPPTLSHEETAALILAGCVAYGMVELSKVKAGDRCLVIGASGGIGTVLIQMLKVQCAHVIAVCSGKNAEFVRSVGTDRVIDYTRDCFTDVLQEEGATCNLAFDIIGGKDVERDAYQVLHRNGAFLTVCGPVKYIGERKLSWVKTISMFAYIFRRIVFSRLRGPQYKFSEKYPRLVIDDMLAMVVNHNIRMPIEQTVPLEEAEMKKALALVTAHRVRGRIVIARQ